MRIVTALAVALAWALPAAAETGLTDLTKKLASRDNEERRDAARNLSELGKGAKPALKPLTKALRDEDRFVRRFAAQALGNIGSDARSAIPALARLLDDDKAAVREAAVKALGRMGTSAVPALTRALGGTSDVQELAINALGECGEAGLPALTGAIRNQKMAAALRLRAVTVLPRNNKARPALPALVEVASRPAPGGRDGRQLRLEAIAAVGRLATASDTAAINALDGINKDPKLRDNQVKNAARKALQAVKTRT